MVGRDADLEGGGGAAQVSADGILLILKEVLQIWEDEGPPVLMEGVFLGAGGREEPGVGAGVKFLEAGEAFGEKVEEFRGVAGDLSIPAWQAGQGEVHGAFSREARRRWVWSCWV